MGGGRNKFPAVRRVALKLFGADAGCRLCRVQQRVRASRRMLRRCFVPYAQHFDRDGACGITVQGPWHELEAFLRDVGLRPSPTPIMSFSASTTTATSSPATF